MDDDSGITLDAADSGIALFGDDSGISLDGEDMGSTQPMTAVAGAAADLGKSGANTMQMDLPSETNDSEFELAGLDDDDDDFGTDTSVLMFDDDDASADDFSVESPAVTADHDDDFVGDDFAADDAFEDDIGDDDFDDDFEDDEMDDVWDAEDDDDDEGFEAGESQVGGDFAPAAAAVPMGWGAAQDQPWGGLWTTFVSFGAILSVMAAFVGIELVRTMWLWTQPGEPQSGLLGLLGSMFGE